MNHIYGPDDPKGKKAMEPIQILLALAFMGGITGLIIVGMRRSLYFYSRGVIGLSGSAGINDLPAMVARSVFVEGATSTRQSDNNLRLSVDPSSRYARGGLMVMAIFLLLGVFAVISLLITVVH
jgi:hypothetical protein